MSVLLLSHLACLRHDPGPGHPECPDRLRALLRAFDTEEFAPLIRAEAPLATREQLLRVHPETHIASILDDQPGEGDRIAIDADTIMSDGSAEAALRAAGAAVAGVDAVCSGEVRKVFAATRPPGHHAEPSQAMGFCLFCNPAVAARHAQAAHGLTRIAIVDFDVHHGNGTQACFATDPDVFYASSHQWPLYPGTGAESETGVGNIINVGLAPGADGEAFRAAWAERILPALDAFAPELLIISAGFDAHARDPLAQIRAREADFAWLTDELCRIAERRCAGRVVSLLEGGYDLDGLALSAAAHLRVMMQH